MSIKQVAVPPSPRYQFVRSKDSYTEGTQTFITLFARLAIEIRSLEEGKRILKRETLWVDIEEIKIEHASTKITEMPNRIWNFEVTDQVFKELLRVSRNCPRELYFISPLLRKSN